MEIAREPASFSQIILSVIIALALLTIGCMSVFHTNKVIDKYISIKPITKLGQFHLEKIKEISQKKWFKINMKIGGIMICMMGLLMLWLMLKS